MSVVLTTFNDAHFLGDALGSVFEQTVPADEVIVVNDGGDDDPGAVVGGYPAARLITQANAGLSAARNRGLKAAKGAAIVFLDADDRLLPNALEVGLACLERAPDAAFAFGGHRRIDRVGRPLGPDISPPHDIGYFNLLHGNQIGMHATVIYRRSALRRVRGFDPRYKRCEDYDVYLRIARRRPIARHSSIVAEYRQHGANMSASRDDMLAWALKVLDGQKASVASDAELLAAWRAGRAVWSEYYGQPRA